MRTFRFRCRIPFLPESEYMNNFPRIRVLAALISGLAACGVTCAVEGGGSNYLLGMKGPLAAFVPKPGVYLTNNVFYYDAGRDNLTPLGNRLVGGQAGHDFNQRHERGRVEKM